MSIVHKGVVLLRVTEPGVIDEIRAFHPIDDIILGWISETEMVVDPAGFKDLVEKLESSGLAPLITRA